MNFVHIADIHLDSHFVNLSDKENMGELRRMEQRKAFKKIIDFIKDNEIECFFIAGDLYENQYIKQSTIEYINNLFKTIPNTKIFITPGNHDPYIKDSYYNKFLWNENVKIFSSKVEKIETKDADIYGFGFDDFYYEGNIKDKLIVENKNKINILVMHAALNGANTKEKVYNPISQKELENMDFDFIALGHIHKRNYENGTKNQKIVYPGSTTSLGFDELGEHGMIVGNIDKNGLELQFVPVDESQFVEMEIDVTSIISKEELIEKINETKINNNQFAKIILTGKRNFEINPYELYKLNLNEKIIKVKDKTKINYDIEKLANQNTLKGLFCSEMLEKIKNETDEPKKRIIENAIEVGLEALE